LQTDTLTIAAGKNNSAGSYIQSCRMDIR